MFTIFTAIEHIIGYLLKVKLFPKIVSSQKPKERLELRLRVRSWLVRILLPKVSYDS